MSKNVEHYESCECCQNFARMEKRYDHLRGYPQDDEVFAHTVNPTPPDAVADKGVSHD